MLIMRGVDRVGKFELKATEQDHNSFKGTWYYEGDYEDQEGVELTLYGDPEGAIALFGHYLYEARKYLWALELTPSED